MADEMTDAVPWRNRITRHADVPPAELVAHPLNVRRHGRLQADALAGVLDRVGLVQSVIVNERTGRMLDGHLRASLAVARGEPSVPVAYVDVSEDDERLILATFDPLGSLAETNADALVALLADVAPSEDALGGLLASLRDSVTPSIPEAREQREPSLASECLIEIRCSSADRDDFSDTLTEWGMRDGVEIDIS